MVIQNISEAEALLRPYVPVKDMAGQKLGLESINHLMSMLGHPERQLRVVHIAGTSGKTSTAYYAAALLAAGGHKVGLTVSPHVDSLTERIQINGRPLSEKVFCAELTIFMKLVARTDVRPTYFELLLAFALWEMARQKVDYAVVETGVGGRLDASNVLRRADKVCMITNIGLDHTELLGHTLEQIAGEKAGIIHEGNHVFAYRQPDAVMRPIERRASQVQAQLHVVDRLVSNETSMPDYQYGNWHLAQAVYQYLTERDKLPRLSDQQLNKTTQIHIPGRMEVRHSRGKTIVLDGAHNAQKMSVFVNSFQRLYPDVKPAVLLALKSDKAYQDIVPILEPLASRVVTTGFSVLQDLKLSSVPPEQLARAFEGRLPVKSLPDQTAALDELLAGPEPVCVITGSLYFLRQIRNNEELR